MNPAMCGSHRLHELVGYREVVQNKVFIQPRQLLVASFLILLSRLPLHTGQRLPGLRQLHVAA